MSKKNNDNRKLNSDNVAATLGASKTCTRAILLSLIPESKDMRNWTKQNLILWIAEHWNESKEIRENVAEELRLEIDDSEGVDDIEEIEVGDISNQREESDEEVSAYTTLQREMAAEDEARASRGEGQHQRPTEGLNDGIRSVTHDPGTNSLFVHAPLSETQPQKPPQFHRNPFECFKGSHFFRVSNELIALMKSVQRADGRTPEPVIGEGFFLLPKDDVKWITQRYVCSPQNFAFPKPALKVNGGKRKEYNRIRKQACIIFDCCRMMLELATNVTDEDRLDRDLMMMTTKVLLHGAEVAMKHLKDIEADSAMVKDKSFLDPTVVSNFSKEDLKRLEEATKISKLVNKAKHAGSYSQRPRYGKWDRQRPRQYGFQRGSYYDRFERRDDRKGNAYRGSYRDDGRRFDGGGKFDVKPSSKPQASNGIARGSGDKA